MVVSIPSPTIKCGITEIPVLVFASKMIGGIPYPVAGAEVKLKLLPAVLWLPSSEKILATDIKGTTQTCVTRGNWVEAKIKKSNEDFGSGINNWYTIANQLASAGSLTFAAEAKAAPPICNPPQIYNPLTGKCETPVIPTLPCTGTFMADLSNISTLVYGITSPLTTLSVPIRLTGSRTSVPVKISVDGREVDRRTTGFSGVDVIRVLGTAGADIGTSHTITIESLATDCTIPPLTINIPSLKPTGLPTPLTPIGCSQLVTTVDSGYPSHPSEITDFAAPFYVYLRGVKEACKDNLSDPAFIKKLPKGTMGTITLGNLSSNFYLTDDGIIDIDLSKLIDLKSLAGAVTGITPPPVVVIQPPPLPSPVLKKPCPAGSPDTRFRDAGTSLAAVQAYLPPGYTAEPTAFGGAGTFKITRLDRSYFYAQSCSDIDTYSRYKG